MKTPTRSPEIEARELKDGSGWYVLVDWGHWPAEQVGGFTSKEEADIWIDLNVFGWLKKRFEAPDPSYRSV